MSSVELKEKRGTDACYLMYDGDGVLVCEYNHKSGEECLMDLCSDCHKMPNKCKCYE